MSSSPRFARGFGLVWFAASIAGAALSYIASRVAQVFSDQGFFVTADMFRQTHWVVWALALSSVAAALLTLVYLVTRRRERFPIVLTVLACCFELGFFGFVFIAIPLIQWANWLSSVAD